MRVHIAGLKGYGYICDLIVDAKRHVNGDINAEGNDLLAKVINESRGNDDKMKIFLAGEHTVKNGNLADWSEANILESYYYACNNKYVARLLQNMDKDRFMLDSGAATFHKGNITVDYDRYTKEYAEFVNKHNIKLFVEMDIDNQIGLKQVEKLRNVLETETGIKPLVVWHPGRGKQYYLDMCKEYKYIGLGGITDKKARDKTKKHFLWFISKAREQGTKIHAFGYTGMDVLKYPFDSVDSTAWLYGNRSGHLYYFDGSRIIKKAKPAGTKLKSRAVALHNFNEWVKFGKYMETFK